MKLTRYCASLVFAACMLAPVGPLLTSAEAASKIVAVVNGRPITSYELQQRSKLIALTTRAPSSVAKRKAREELIDEALKLEEAKRVGVSIKDSQVDDAFASIAKRVNLSQTQFKQALSQSGVNSRTLKNRLRAEITWSEVVMQRFRATVRINESDVIALLQGKEGTKDSATTSVEYDLQRIIFVVPKNASKSFKNKRAAEMKRLRARFTSCEEGTRIAAGLNEVIVRPIGKRLETDLPAGFVKQLNAISVGRVTAPTPVDSGFEMIALCGKETINSDATARSTIEGELRNKKGQQLSRRYLRDLRSNAVIEQR
ncbi:Chaperone SurA precursor [Pseudovibrio axinellae]|uniref:Chaperone SurA n=1 Tax=Pseudovibrio axinellae TaxID=989403 RepID=A0A165UL80_9HYPH|nr:SurA N-terminal domain-containing protein [Pseudovibrio axinellae]KZL12501.1 Chaperone SurA precursor [Pseudovibrio axinellae]SEP69506.1 periplasmic chaperone for outer membrane proteins SurA [Pseudovibrio axinellae]